MQDSRLLPSTKIAHSLPKNLGSCWALCDMPPNFHNHRGHGIIDQAMDNLDIHNRAVSLTSPTHHTCFLRMSRHVHIGAGLSSNVHLASSASDTCFKLSRDTEGQAKSTMVMTFRPSGRGNHQHRGSVWRCQIDYQG